MLQREEGNSKRGLHFTGTLSRKLLLGHAHHVQAIAFGHCECRQAWMHGAGVSLQLQLSQLAQATDAGHIEQVTEGAQVYPLHWQI